VIDFLPAETRRIGRNGFQINRIRYWDPLLARLFPPTSRVLVRHDPRNLWEVYVPSPSNAEYLAIPCGLTSTASHFGGAEPGENYVER
jgi:hypothetical protein